MEIDQLMKEMMNDPDWEKEILDRYYVDSCGECSGCGPKNMSDALCNCVRCGKPLVLIADLIEYSCPYCGFEWEILEGE